MHIQYIKGIKTVLAGQLSRQVDASLTYFDYEPKGQEFRYTLCKELPFISNADSTNMLSINVLDNLTNDSDTHNNKNLQNQEPYCNCIYCTLYISTVWQKFTMKGNYLYKV